MSTDSPEVAGRIVALAGGVGAARFLRGLVRCVDPARLSVVVNTGDDREFYGVHVSPDIDIVTYTLAGVIEPKRGFGLAGDTFSLVTRLEELGHPAWFRLGDRDFAQCLHRTLRLRAGASLAEVTDELRRAHGLALEILPMSDAPCPTFVVLQGERRVHFEEYLVRDGAPTDVERVDLSAAESAPAAPAVLARIREADLVLVCPSNPVVSIGPILAVAGVREALAASPAPIVAVSPIVGGAPIKGPADTLMRAAGIDVSAHGVASLYADWIDGLVIDARDSEHQATIESLDLACSAVDTIMADASASERLARDALSLAREIGSARS